MIGESEPLQDTGAPGKLDRATDAVQAAARTVKETTQSLADAIEARKQPAAPLDHLTRWAQEAPLHSLAIALLLGVLLGGRRCW
jgi:hypothetical protein